MGQAASKNTGAVQASRLNDVRRGFARSFTRPIIDRLSRTGISPNAVTWIGFFITVGAAVLIIAGQLFIAGFVVLFAGLFDMLDGALARATGRVSRFGAVIDSVLDRVSEGVLLIAILVHYVARPDMAGAVLTMVALLLSLLVSYVRARAECLGLEGKSGVFTRPERVVALAIGLWLDRFPYALFTVLAIIAAFSLVSVIQRLVQVWQQTKNG